MRDGDLRQGRPHRHRLRHVHRLPREAARPSDPRDPRRVQAPAAPVHRRGHHPARLLEDLQGHLRRRLLVPRQRGPARARRLAAAHRQARARAVGGRQLALPRDRRLGPDGTGAARLRELDEPLPERHVRPGDLGDARLAGAHLVGDTAGARRHGRSGSRHHQVRPAAGGGDPELLLGGRGRRLDRLRPCALQLRSGGGRHSRGCVAPDVRPRHGHQARLGEPGVRAPRPTCSARARTTSRSPTTPTTA